MKSEEYQFIKGLGHDSKYGNETIAEIPENGIGIMDRGFSSIDRIKELLEKNDRFFVLRIKNNTTLELLENGNSLIGTKSNQVKARVVNFCDLRIPIKIMGVFIYKSYTAWF